MTTESLHECSCGQVHVIKGLASVLIARCGPDVTVETPAGRWRVPRAWIAAHGLKADEVPALAGRYGWKAASE